MKGPGLDPRWVARIPPDIAAEPVFWRLAAGGAKGYRWMLFGYAPGLVLVLFGVAVNQAIGWVGVGVAVVATIGLFWELRVWPGIRGQNRLFREYGRLRFQWWVAYASWKSLRDPAEQEP